LVRAIGPSGSGSRSALERSDERDGKHEIIDKPLYRFQNVRDVENLHVRIPVDDVSLQTLTVG
jgi:hypothetical protein